MTPTDSLMRDFERELDAALMNLAATSRGGGGAISLAAKMIEACYSQKAYGVAGHFKRGLEVLAPHLVRQTKGPEPGISELIHDLEFAGHYYILRDYLYYSYNAPGSLSWQYDNSSVVIKFMDPSIPRDYYLKANNWFVNSMERFADRTAHEQIVARIRDKPPAAGESLDEDVVRAIEAEIDAKLSLYFNFLRGQPIDLGVYRFTDFELVFRALLMQALFHRYHGEALGLEGPVYFERGELLDTLSVATELTPSTCDRVLTDIVYSRRLAKARIQPMYVALYELEQNGRIVMVPSDFAKWEAYVDILRITAQRNPALFLKNVSDPLSKSFVKTVAKMFEDQGFSSTPDVNLSRFDPTLPDIDLLVISEEATLGYVVIACELKAPIPAQWAKDHLRALNEDSVAKAFRQLDKIAGFFSTDEGVRFLASRLPTVKPPHLSDGFLVVPKYVVVTSDNAGMFFSDQIHTIIDYQTLRRALEKCDGDIAYLLKIFGELPSWLDRGRKIGTQEVLVGNRTVTYEVSEITHLIHFSSNQYKSAGVDKEMLDEFLRSGGHPFDVLLDSEPDSPNAPEG